MSAPNSPYYGESHAAFRDTLRRFVEREIAPFVDAWDEAEEFPRELYRKAADVGLLGLGFPEEYGGVPGDESSPRRSWRAPAPAASRRA